MSEKYQIGSKIMNNWTLTKKIGEGSYGKVYRIEREEFGQVYEAALKIITIPQSSGDVEAAYSEGLTDESVTEYFRSFVEDIVAEFALMSQLKGNSNIVSYEDHMVVPHEDGVGWDILIRMELLTPLISYAQEHPLTEEDVLRMGKGLTQALELCRRKGIIHRDIKPENIFVTADGEFKLGDFGVARAVEKTVSAMSRKGTYSYMAPEVYKGEEYGYQADLYSLGLVLYRYLNDNRTPFMPPYPAPIQYSDREKALNARISGQPVPAPAHGSDGLKAVVLKACAYRPEDRYEDAAQMGAALHSIDGQAVPTDKAEAVRKSVQAAGPVDEPGSMPERIVKAVTDEDDFDRTVSTFSASRPASRKPAQSAQAEPAPVRESAPVPEKIAEGDVGEGDDDFDKTVSTFSASRPASRKPMQSAQAESAHVREPAPKPEMRAEAAEAEEDDDDFERTVSTFSTSRPSPKEPAQKATEPVKEPASTPERKSEAGEADEDDFEKTVSAFTTGRAGTRQQTSVKPAGSPGLSTGKGAGAKAPQKLALPLKILLILYVVIDVGLKLISNLAVGLLAIVFWAVVYIIRTKGLQSNSGAKIGGLVASGIALMGLSIFFTAMWNYIGMILKAAFMPLVIVMNVISFVLAYLLIRKCPRA